MAATGDSARTGLRRAASVGLLTLALAAGCTDDAGEPTPTSPPTSAPATTDPAGAEPGEQRFPDVLDVQATYDPADNTWAFAVTMSSPYDTPERYADGWRVVGPDGTVYGEHTLTHDHAAEQPFTRTQRGVAIPDEIRQVTIEGRDLEYGFGGTTVTVDIVPTG